MFSALFHLSPEAVPSSSPHWPVVPYGGTLWARESRNTKLILRTEGLNHPASVTLKLVKNVLLTLSLTQTAVFALHADTSNTCSMHCKYTLLMHRGHWNLCLSLNNVFCNNMICCCLIISGICSAPYWHKIPVLQTTNEVTVCDTSCWLMIINVSGVVKRKYPQALTCQNKWGLHVWQFLVTGPGGDITKTC